jgi:hypothetical protein
MAMRGESDQTATPAANADLGTIAGASKTWGLALAREEWYRAAEHMSTSGERLITMWASRTAAGENLIRAAFAAGTGTIVLTLQLTAAESDYPGLQSLFPSARRMQRAIADLSRLRSSDTDQRPWLRHRAWPATFHPAARLGLTGFAERASGLALDLRCDLPCDPYGELAPKKVVRTEGDVAARVAVRFDEVVESIRLVNHIVPNLPDGGRRRPAPRSGRSVSVRPGPG